MSKDIQEIPPNDTDDSFVGVDLGIVNQATDSRGQFYGSEHWEEVARRHAVLRSELQSKGTRSAKRKLKKAQRKRFHKWSFAQFQAFVEDKTQAVGVSVVFVDPRYTSQKCSQCKHVSHTNRPEQSVFKCRVCKFTCHADHNAAINIRANYLQFKGLSRCAIRTSCFNQPIVVTQGDTSFG